MLVVVLGRSSQGHLDMRQVFKSIPSSAALQYLAARPLQGVRDNPPMTTVTDLREDSAMQPNTRGGKTLTSCASWRLPVPLLALVLFAGTLCCASYATAQEQRQIAEDVSSSAPQDDKRWRLGGEVALTDRPGLRDQVWAFSPMLNLAYRGWRRLSIIGTLGGVALIDIGEDGNSATTLGASNLAGGVRYELIRNSVQELSIKAELIAPLAWLGRDALAGQRRAGFALAAGMRGLWNPWLWAPEQAGAALGVRFVEHFSPLATVQLEAGAGSTLSLGIATADRAELYGQLAVEGAIHLMAIDVGGRLQGVWMTADRAAMQLSVAPFLGVHAGAISVRGQLLFNLDEPLGFIGDGMHVWAATLGLETRL